MDPACTRRAHGRHFVARKAEANLGWQKVSELSDITYKASVVQIHFTQTRMLKKVDIQFFHRLTTLSLVVHTYFWITFHKKGSWTLQIVFALTWLL
jgi:hypothetical protein